MTRSDPRVIVVGGGIIGTAVAWTLTELGITDVEIIEKRRLASGATGVCPGGLRQQFEGEADCILARDSLRFYESINERLTPEYPFAIERSGYLFLAETEARLQRFRDNVAMQNRLGIPSTVLSPDEIRRLVPALQGERILGGSFCAEDGFLEDCHGVTYAFAARARSRGARVTYEEVLSVEPNGAGWRIATPTRRLDAEHVVIAAGADSVALLSAIVPLPIQAERRRIVYSGPATPGQVPPLIVALDRGFAAKQLISGVFYLGWLGENPAADDMTFVEEALTRGAPLLPLLNELPIGRVMAGTYDNTPDHRPVLGAIEGAAGLWIAAGFSGHGFMTAPAAAEIVASAICERSTTLPAAAFSLGRFAQPRPEEGLFI